MPKSKVTKQSAPDILIITGLSGSGMTSGTNDFGDLGYFCVDNMPLTLLPTFVRLVRARENESGGSARGGLGIRCCGGGVRCDFGRELCGLGGWWLSGV